MSDVQQETLIGGDRSATPGAQPAPPMPRAFPVPPTPSPLTAAQVPGPAAGGTPWAVPTTSGLAITSLVLSILWLGGVGSLLAIVLGAIALSKIKSSRGARKGRGVAVAAVTIGIVGVLGACAVGALTFAGIKVFHAIDRRTAPVTVSMGQPAHIASSEFAPGITSVTVSSLSESSAATNMLTGQPSPAPGGKQFAMAQVQECAGPSGSRYDLNAVQFTVGLPGGSTVRPTPLVGEKPVLQPATSLAANACVSGFVTFEVPAGVRPVSVRYDAGLLDHTYVWPVPAA